MCFNVCIFTKYFEPSFIFINIHCATFFNHSVMRENLFSNLEFTYRDIHRYTIFNFTSTRGITT